MSNQILHFIWQNPGAREKIYPNRIAKLRDFLLTYKEADLMAQYEALPRPERVAQVTQELSNYEQELLALGDNHFALLTKVIDYLDQSPRDFKSWAKYMVVHFSGMRYKSAHSSWAETRDLLKVLLKHKLFDPTLLGGVSPDNMTDEQVLEILRELRPGGQNAVPSWAWLVMVLHTDLRLTYITPENSNILDLAGSLNTPGYLEALSHSDPFIQTLLDWLHPTLEIMQKENRAEPMTSWRDKHYKDFSLVVLQAVCNEISEHVHHIRLLDKAGGGLSSRPNWYFNFEKAGKSKAIANVSKGKTKKKPEENKPQVPDPNDFSDEFLLDLPADDSAYFRRPLNEKFFKPGASILWLGWVSTPKPNEWQFAYPLRGYNFNRGGQSNINWKYSTQTIVTMSGQPRTIFAHIETVEKDKKKADGKKANITPKGKVEWLRWTHEAIVMDVVDLIAGRTVLTFETEPVTGLNKRPLGGLCNVNGDQPWWHVFVGYAGEKQLDQFHQEYLADMTSPQFITEPEEVIPFEVPAFALDISYATPSIAAGLEVAPGIQMRFKKLTPRQRQAAALFCQGLAEAQIAVRMDTTVEKVQANLRKAAERMGLSNPQELKLLLDGIDFGKWNVLAESSY